MHGHYHVSVIHRLWYNYCYSYIQSHNSSTDNQLCTSTQHSAICENTHINYNYNDVSTVILPDAIYRDVALITTAVANILVVSHTSI